MSLKALVMDVDDTLYDHVSHEIPPRHLQVLNQARQAGLKVFLCTGRPMAMLKDLLDLKPGQFDGIVSGNGCAAWDADLKPVMEKVLPGSVVKKAMEIARTMDCPLFCAGSESMMVTRLSPLGKRVFDHMEVQNMPVRDPDPDTDRFSLVEFQPDPPLTYFAEGEAMKGVRVVYFPEFTDLNPEGTSKVTGIHALMDLYGFKPQEYIAFGDSVNDQEMILDAQIGVAMGNAGKDLKALTLWQTTSCHEAGIAHFFEQTDLLHHLHDWQESLNPEDFRMEEYAEDCV